MSTRSDLDIQGNAFYAGETIKAYITDSDDGVIGNPTLYTTAEPENGVNELIPNVQPYYPNKDVTVDVVAVYPPVGVVVEDENEVDIDITKETTSFTVSTDQRSNTNYKKSDLMYASVSGQPRSEKTIHLHFSHLMAKLVVNAEVRDELKIKSIVVKNVKTTMAFNVSSGIKGDTSIPRDIVLFSESENYPTTASGAILFPPQVLSGDFIEVETEDGTAKFVIESKSFDEGVEYTANLVVSRETLNMTASIVNWNEAEGVVPIVDVGNGFVIDGDIAPRVYNGEPYEPVIDGVNLKVKNGGIVVEPSHYDYTYYNNVKAGTALLVVFGKVGDEAGKTAIKPYIIQKAPCEMSYTELEKTVDYVAKGVVENVLLNPGDGSKTYTSSDDAVASVSSSGKVTMKKDGVTKIRVSMDSNGNYEAGMAEYTLTINKRNASNFTVSFTNGAPDYTYDGNKKEPQSITVKDTDAEGNLVELEENIDYTVGYADNINAGTNTAQVVITGINRYAHTKSLSFTIKQAQAVISMPAAGGSKIIGIDDFYDCQATTNIGTIEYSSSKPDVASVSLAGIVRGVSSFNDYVTISASVPNDPNGNYLGTTSASTVQIKVEQMKYTFEYEGNYRTWSTPVTAIYTFELIGGAGGNSGGGQGGRGGLVRATRTLNAGQTIYIYVGGGGTTGSAGWNGGGTPASGKGGGGGATDIRMGGTALGNRVLVAGGGGGASGSNMYGTAGGSRGSGNTEVLGNGASSDDGGGAGGGYTGGMAGNSWSGAYGGSNYIKTSDWTALKDGISTNGPTSGSDNTAHHGKVVVTYKYE